MPKDLQKILSETELKHHKDVLDIIVSKLKPIGPGDGLACSAEFFNGVLTIIHSHEVVFKANATISFRHLRLKRAISKVVCLNIPMPDEVFNLLNTALEADTNDN